MKNGIRAALLVPLGERPLTLKPLSRRRVSAAALGDSSSGPSALPHLQDVEQPVDAVLQPVDDQDPPDIPAEPQDAGERDEVGEDQRDDGADRGADLVPGDEALHAPDASRVGAAAARMR